MTTLNLGNGENIVYVAGGTGESKITTGKDADNITVTNSGKATINAGAGNDTITAGVGNSTITGGLGNDKFVFSKATGGINVITDADVNDSMQITDVSKSNIFYGRAGNNLEIFFDDTFNSDNKIVLQNYFSKKQEQRLDVIEASDGTINLSTDLAYTISGTGKITGTKEGENKRN